MIRCAERLLVSHLILATLALGAGCSGRDKRETAAAPDASPAPVYEEIFDDAVPHEFIIEISQEEWEGITQDMLDYAEKFPITPFYDGDGREYRTDKYHKADFIYRRADGSEVKLSRVGIRSRGNESRRLPYRNGNYYKSHFKVKFDETFDMAKSDANYAAIDIGNLDDYRFLANNHYLFFNTAGKIAYIPYDFDISLGTNWHGELPYNQFINQDIFNTMNLAATWGEGSARPLVDKVLAVDKYRQRYLQLLKDDALASNKLFVFSQYQAKFDQLFALYGSKTDSDTMDPDPMDLAGFEQKYFVDKTKNVLDQLKVGYAGYEVE